MTTPNIDNRITHIEATLPHLATKADVETLRADNASLRTDMIAGDAALKSEIAALRIDMTAGNAALRIDMTAGDAALRTDIYRMESRLIKWMVGMTVILSSLMTILLTIFRFLG